MGFKYLKKETINKLPKTAGVYAFKKGAKRGARPRREGGGGVGVLYIGKAANLQERVKNHFQRPAYRDGLFLDKIKKIGWIPTNSEIEALILEANLIKKYQPKYNVVWRDDKNYFYTGITKEDYPRIFITHQPKRDPSSSTRTGLVGPFVDGTALKQTLKILRKVFPYRTCKTLPKKPCLWYQLERCLAPCLIKSELATQLPSFQTKMKKECQQNAKNLMKILQGKKIQAIIDLKKEMKLASASQNFEKAAKIRDQIGALEKILAHAKIFGEVSTTPQSNFWPYKRIEAYDISNIQGQEATGSMVTFINGLPDKNFYRRFRIKIAGKPNDVAMIKEVLTRRFKHLGWGLPDLILIDGGKAQLNVAIKCLRWNLKQVKVMAIAKKKNELYIEGREKPVLLKSLPREIFNLILQLRDEAHRFAQSYHRKLRKKALLGD